MWREKYDMEADRFAAETERLWQQVKPLYDSLYNFTRRKLSEKYGPQLCPTTAQSRRICWATCGRRNGEISIPCLRRRVVIAVTI